MGTLIKWELKRFAKRKYVFVITLLLILLNLYIVNYDYDSFLNYNMYMENMGEELNIIQGEITPEKREFAKQQIKNIDQERQHAKTEAEGSQLVMRRFVYNDYLNYQDNPLFPFSYGNRTFENRDELIGMLNNHEPQSAEHTKLSGYLGLTENVITDRFYIMRWDYISQQNFLLFLMIVLVVAMAPVFGEDYSSGVASLTLSSKYGRTKLVKARMFASMIFGTFLLASFFVTELIMKLSLEGVNGFQGRISQMGFIYLPNVTPLIGLTVFFLFTLLSAMSLALLTLVIALFTRKTFTAMIVMVLINIVAESVKFKYINNFSIRLLVNNFYSSFIEYNPISVFGNIIHYPIFLVFWVLVISALSALLVLNQGGRQHL
ncbi:hypothetical protein HYG86_01435 [Alkalicella caledoniensis]|uniref:Uncharacterized protein n=1 Tax=Alkalicella caledoniensis TaxID=2731377 RepID=A0A7G9W4B0_ALKCA|nr:hypothetical protein [Alkalicella caledoniensis]QNO13522.1 hypothetical protein HYG86_01435 [Alkalicella caledoniensis]